MCVSSNCGFMRLDNLCLELFRLQIAIASGSSAKSSEESNSWSAFGVRN